MSSVHFTLCNDSESGLVEMVDLLNAKCTENNLTLQEGQFFGSFRKLSFHDGTKQFRANLSIKKIKGITYNQIYRIVNGVYPTHYKIIP